MRLLLLSLFAFLSLSVYAQECCVRISLRLDGSCHDDSKRERDWPNISSVKVDESSKQLIYEGRNTNYDASCVYNYRVEYTVTTPPTQAKIVSHIRNFGSSSGSTDEIVKLNSLKIGANTHSTTEKKAKCIDRPFDKWDNWDYYTLHTTLIVDPTVRVSVISTNHTHLVVENDDKLKLKFGNYYTGSDANPKLEVKINGITSKDLKGRECTEESDGLWLKLPHSVKPNGVIELSYYDIVGEPSEDNPLYKNASGRTMSFRVKKKMIDGTYRVGNVIENVRFYHQGPKFKLVQSRWVNCIGGDNFLLYVKFDNPKDVNLYNADHRLWVLNHSKENGKVIQTFYLDMNNAANDGVIQLSGPSKDGVTTLAKYLAEKSDDATLGKWDLQFQYKDEYYSKEFSFTTEEIYIRSENIISAKNRPIAIY